MEFCSTVQYCHISQSAIENKKSENKFPFSVTEEEILDRLRCKNPKVRALPKSLLPRRLVCVQYIIFLEHSLKHYSFIHAVLRLGFLVITVFNLYSIQ